MNRAGSKKLVAVLCGAPHSRMYLVYNAQLAQFPNSPCGPCGCVTASISTSVIVMLMSSTIVCLGAVDIQN